MFELAREICSCAPSASSRQFSQHLCNPNRVIPGGEAAGRLGDSAKTENVKNGGAFVGAALGDDEMTPAVGSRSAPGAFGDIEDDADGSSFELIA